MHRFFVSPDCITGDVVTLDGDVARQLAHVLRARAGDHVVVLDGTGWEYDVALRHVDPKQATGAVTGRLRSRGEPALSVTLYQALLKGDRFETVLQKGTELGVAAFVPVLCARSVPRDKEERWARTRYPRWQRIIKEAAEQSRRGRLPTLESLLDFSAACDACDTPAVIPWEQETTTALKGVLGRWKAEGSVTRISVFVGPEGGFTVDEIEHARDHGVTPASLGRRILRAETASIATVAAVMYELGELGDERTG